MKYKLELVIALPRSRVIELFDDAENLKQWQPELISFEHLSGKAGRVGAKSKILYKMGKKEVEMIETVTSKNLPEEFIMTYEAKNVWNKVENSFSEISECKTKWHFESEFKCGGLLRVLAFLMPGMFKKQSFKYMKQFKQFAENS